MDSVREPHSLSLKVLRLSKPSFSQQFPLPEHHQDLIPRIDSRATPLPVPDEIDDRFILSPLLNLPPAFGSAHVGETFSCTLCANNELEAGTEKVISSVKITAEMQAPSLKIPLELTPLHDESATLQIEPGKFLQKILRFELREEGTHVLAVSLSYSETTMSQQNSASSGRVRTFRKLYQFVAQPCLSVRTKVSEISAPRSDEEKSNAQKPQRFALEAQLENVADGPITLEKVTFDPKSPFSSTSINWDVARPGSQQLESPILIPRDVFQVAFLVQQQEPQRGESHSKETTKDGRIILGQLHLQWRTSMGDLGYLSTGWLMTRKR